MQYDIHVPVIRLTGVYDSCMCLKAHLGNVPRNGTDTIEFGWIMIELGLWNYKKTKFSYRYRHKN